MKREYLQGKQISADTVINIKHIKRKEGKVFGNKGLRLFSYIYIYIYIYIDIY